MATTSATHEPPAQSAQANKLEKAKVNLKYLAFGASAGVAPASLTTRSFLTTTRRLIRYAKYAAIGGIAAVLGGTLLGTLGSGIAFFAAPSLGVGMGLGVLTAVTKFGWRHRGNHFRWGGALDDVKARAASGADGASDEATDAKKSDAASRRSDSNRQDVWMRA